jgi:hypothetical protein
MSQSVRVRASDPAARRRARSIRTVAHRPLGDPSTQGKSALFEVAVAWASAFAGCGPLKGTTQEALAYAKRTGPPGPRY